MKELTQSEQEKRDRLRKNLRFLALAAACYYFFSAGLSYYEDIQAEKTRVVVEISDPFATKDDFLRVYKAKAGIDSLQIEDLRVNGLDGFGFKAPNGTASVKGEYEYAKDGRLNAVYFESAFDEGLSLEDLASFQSFAASCENNGTEEITDGILKALKLDVKDRQELIDGIGAKSKYIAYTLKLENDGRISVKAVRSR